MRLVLGKSIQKKVVEAILAAQSSGQHIEAIVLTDEEFNELRLLPKGSTMGDPLGQRAIQWDAKLSTLTVMGVPVYEESHSRCPE